MHFKLVLDIDAPVRVAERIRKLRPQAAEAVFWDRLRQHAENPEIIPTAIYKIHQFVRKSFADNLHYELTERLKAHLDVDKPEVARAIEALEIQVLEIEGGSLEILMFVLGFGRLATLTGITAEEFAEFLQVAASPAMTAIFGVSGLVRAQAMPVANPGEGSPADRSYTMSPMRYGRAAALAVLVLGLGAWATSGVGTGLIEEHKAFANYAQTETGRGTRTDAPAQLSEPPSKIEDQPNPPLGESIRVGTGSTTADAQDKETVQEANAAPRQPSTTSPNTCLLDANLIRRVQYALNQQHFYFGSLDGALGGWTRVGLSNFQARAGLPATGTPDTTTLGRLGIPCGNG